MSNAISGVGTAFKRGDGASNEVFTAVSEVDRIAGPTMTRDFIDVTNLDSTGGYRDFIAGFRDGGEVTLTMNFALGTYADMLTDFETAGTVNYQIVLGYTGNTTLDFAGFVTGLPLDVAPDTAVTADVTIKVDGQVTLTS